MKFNDMDEMFEYLEMNSVSVTEQLPYCRFCDEVIDSYDGVVEYCKLEIPEGYEIFCCEGHMQRYLEQFIEEK